MSSTMRLVLITLFGSRAALAWNCAPQSAVALADPATSAECGALAQSDCCSRCYQRQYAEGCIATVWNQTGCCSYHASTSQGTVPKSDSITLVASWAPAPSPSPSPTPSPTPPPPPPPTPTPPSPVPCGVVSEGGSTWVISGPCSLSCPSSSCTFSFDTIRVHAGGALHVQDKTGAIRILARIFVVDGEFTAGSESKPFSSELDIVLTGKSSDQDDPTIPKVILGHGAGTLPYSKVLLAGNTSTVSLHGQPKLAWTKLAETAKAGSSQLRLAEAPSGWRAGDRLIVPSTGMVGQSENEVVTLVSVAEADNGGVDVTVKEKLQYDHYGASPDARLNGEVGVLSHNIRIMGNNDDEEHAACANAMAKLSSSNANSVKLTRDTCYGGHTAALEGAVFQVSNVELTRMGQATRIARYPFHFHLAADAGSRNGYIRGCSIWASYQRCVTVHGTWGTTIENNVCFGTYGHAFYLEDGIEHDNTFSGNLAVQVRRGPMVCTDSQVGPSAFWITNPNNTFVNNLAVDIGDDRGGIGYWIVASGSIASETGPPYMGTNFWEASYQAKVAGLVFNPSRAHFGGETGHPAAPTWMLAQQQSRTPLKKFSGNGVRSSFRGVHLDGFVTSSVPGEIGDNIHDPEGLPVFDGKDGTCDFFPAGNYAVPSAEGIHVYAPVHFSYGADGEAHSFSPAWSLIDGLHISRCYETWWSRAARVNISNSLFAWNWVGMTNHIPGEHFCPHQGSSRNPGLANHIIDSLFIGHGDETMNKILCTNAAKAKASNESPAGIRQYDGAFWLSNSRWVNMSTVTCSQSTEKSLPYAMVSGRQEDCNGKFPIQLYNSWPLGASPQDSGSGFSWALQGAPAEQNLGQFSGTASCGRGPSGGVVDMTGTLDPVHPSAPTAYFAMQGKPANPGCLASYTPEQLRQMKYGSIAATAKALVVSKAWYFQTQENPDYGHVCGYCFYDEPNGCPEAPGASSNGGSFVI